jgi:hypothetical protein
MSAIASVTVLPKTALPLLREAATPKKSLFGSAKDGFPKVLAQNGRPLGDYPWSGYVLATLLPFLEETRGIALMKSEYDDLASLLAEKRGATYFFITQDHKKWLADLDPVKFGDDELRDYYNEFNEAQESGAGQPMLDGVRFLREAVAAVDASTVALLSIF